MPTSLEHARSPDDPSAHALPPAVQQRCKPPRAARRPRRPAPADAGGSGPPQRRSTLEPSPTGLAHSRAAHRSVDGPSPRRLVAFESPGPVRALENLARCRIRTALPQCPCTALQACPPISPEPQAVPIRPAATRHRRRDTPARSDRCGREWPASSATSRRGVEPSSPGRRPRRSGHAVACHDRAPLADAVLWMTTQLLAAQQTQKPLNHGD